MEFLTDPAALFSVKGKVAIVVGATGAFGSLAAQVLAAAGAKLVLAGGNGENLAKVARLCQTLGAEVVPVTRRVEGEKDAADIVAVAVDAFDGVDILVSAAGTNDVATIDQMSAERFRAVMDANVLGSWLIAKAVASQLIEQGRGGKIVLMSSARGVLGHPAGYSAYCASKSAIDGIVRALGCELGKHAISVNAIAPTVFRSALTAWMFDDSERAQIARQGLMPRLPLGRLGEPEDLAGPLLFLCAKASDFYTGHVLYADGGYTSG